MIRDISGKFHILLLHNIIYVMFYDFGLKSKGKTCSSSSYIYIFKNEMKKIHLYFLCLSDFI
jgi:hypothetical protein